MNQPEELRVPHTPEAERSVIGQMMNGGAGVVAEVVGTQLVGRDFHIPAHRMIYERLYENFHADDPIDALSIAEPIAPKLAKAWSCDESEAVTRVGRMATENTFAGDPVDHARLVKKDAQRRWLLSVAASIENEVQKGERDPQEIAATASHRTMRIATTDLLTQEIHPFGDLGREFVRYQKHIQAVVEAGGELGAFFDLRFIDNFTHGLQPTELMMTGGEPGAGKSAVIWKAALNFAERQAKKLPHEQVGAFVLSLEMGQVPSNQRVAQTLTGIDSGLMRAGKLSNQQMGTIVQEWGRRKNIPLYFNFTSTLRASQLRALVVEAIRRHNVGLIVVDHFRYFDMDRRYDNAVQEDEEKARFLKESIAKDLNVAVMCIAHTTKAIEATADKRPNLSHLRGSGQVAAHADFVNFVYRPFMYATEDAKIRGEVRESDAEMIWRKNRHGLDGIAPFFFEPSSMAIR